MIDLRDQIRAILEDPDIDELDLAVEALHSVMKSTLDRLNGDLGRYRDALGLAKANPAPGSSHRLRDKLRQAEAERDALKAEIARLNDQVWRTTTCLNAAKAMIGVYKLHISRQRQRADKAKAELDQLADYGLKHRERAERAEAALERVREAIHIADRADVTDWQRGYRACADRVVGAVLALDQPEESHDPA